MAEVPDALWHATPLHYLPSILEAGSLYAQSRFRDVGLAIRPRPGPARRLRALGLTGYVFLSFAPITPLLVDKRRKGYPHALLRFSPEALDLPGVALGRYNTKAWAHRELFVPVTDPAAKAALLAERARGRFRSLEALVPDALPLAPFLEEIALAGDDEAAALGLDDPRVRVAPERFPPGPAPDLSAVAAWSTLRRAAPGALPPPDLPFD